MTKLNISEFINAALEGNGVQNDDHAVWVVIDDMQYTISIDDVLGREEQEPFEASYALEGNLEHNAWKDLYEQYLCDKGI